MKALRIAALSLVWSLLLCAAALAADGYILSLSPELAEIPEGVRPLTETLWYTEDAETLEALLEQGVVTHWEADRTITLDPDISPAPAATPRRAALAASLQSWTRPMLGLDYAEAQHIEGEGVKIAVIDSGLDSGFAEMTEATVLPVIDFTGEGTADTVGHGTAVTSVIASAAFGIAPKVTILPLKCFSGNTQGDISVIIAAVERAITEQCQIINMSFGDADIGESILKLAVKKALDKGIIVVAASGNLTSSSGNDPLVYPAAYSGVIGVGSVDSGKTVAAGSVQNASVTVTAPGQNVVVYKQSGSALQAATGSGTSYAAPVVTGLAALALSVKPDLTRAEFTALLTATAEDRGDEGRDNSYGDGLVNGGLLLAALKEDTTSLLLSRWQNQRAVSAYLPAEAQQLCITALYDKDGRFLALRQEAGAYLSALPLPAACATCKVLTVRDYAPSRGVRLLSDLGTP